jgi:hypothetical protein
MALKAVALRWPVRRPSTVTAVITSRASDMTRLQDQLMCQRCLELPTMSCNQSLPGRPTSHARQGIDAAVYLFAIPAVIRSTPQV